MVLFPCQYGDASYTTYVDTTVGLNTETNSVFRSDGICGER